MMVSSSKLMFICLISIPVMNRRRMKTVMGMNMKSLVNQSIPLVVTVSKKGGPSLKFNCTAFPDEIAINSLTVRNPNSEDKLAYEGPDFHDLDENLQEAFHKYLEIRGIKPSTTNYLHEYMISKDSREYLRWLKNLRKFVEE